MKDRILTIGENWINQKQKSIITNQFHEHRQDTHGNKTQLHKQVNHEEIRNVMV